MNRDANNNGAKIQGETKNMKSALKREILLSTSVFLTRFYI